jgi:hypothetical protein
MPCTIFIYYTIQCIKKSSNKKPPFGWLFGISFFVLFRSCLLSGGHTYLKTKVIVYSVLDRETQYRLTLFYKVEQISN